MNVSELAWVCGLSKLTVTPIRPACAADSLFAILVPYALPLTNGYYPYSRADSLLLRGVSLYCQG